MDRAAALRPIWDGYTVFAESVMFFPSPRTGELEPAPLFYPADEIIGVTSSDFMIEYKEKQDYYLKNGQLYRAPESRIPAMTYDEYYLKEPSFVSIASVEAPGRYVRYEPGGFYHKRQLAVTYRHSGHWDGPRQLCVQDRLPKTLQRLERREPVKLLIYGDSLMEGCDVSGRYALAPYLAPFTELFVQWLREQWLGSEISVVNSALGGTDSNWGLAQAQTRVAEYEPDLVLINFGMNDSGTPVLPEQYEANIRGILRTVRERKPDSEFLLLTPGVANPDCLGWTRWQPHYRPALERIQADTPGTAVIQVGEIQQYILTHKRYGDLSGNGVNHLNDFMTRVYAQVLICALSGEVS